MTTFEAVDTTMSLKERITEDMKAAMRAKDSERLGTIRLLTAALKQKEVDERIELDDAQVIGVIDKLVKQRKDSISRVRAGRPHGPGRQGKRRMKVLQAYLPARLSADEVAAEVRAMLWPGRRTGPRRRPGDMGKVMGAVKARLAGKADMATVSAAVKAALAG
jgi:uncharacterized protein